MTRDVRDVIIVGAGHNGLVCATYLARAGLDVLVLERRHLVGGACVTEELFPGFHVSSCAYIAHNLNDTVVRELDLHRHGLSVTQLDPASVIVFPDGERFVNWRSPERLYDEAMRFSRRDAEGIVRWENMLAAASSVFARYELAEPPTVAELLDELDGTADGDLLAGLLASTARETVEELFETDELRTAVLTRNFDFKLDEPGTPFAAAFARADHHGDPALEGIVAGGMGAITQALQASAREAGVALRLGAEVRRILIDDRGAAVGVELRDGQTLRSRLVVSNADPKRTLLDLVGRSHLSPESVGQLDAVDTDLSCVKFHAAVGELPDFSAGLGADFDPRLAAMVRLCPTSEHFFAAGQAAAEDRLPDPPVMAVQIPTVHDRSVAPEGCHTVSIWARFYSPRPPAGIWSDHRTAIGLQLIDILTQYAPNFADSLIDWCVYTPGDLEERMYLTDGNIRHATIDQRQVLADRLFGNGGHRTSVEDLYLCGVGTHPGGEVSGACGYIAANTVLADIQSARR